MTGEMAMWAAVKRYLQLDHESERLRWLEQIEEVSIPLRTLSGVTLEIVEPPIANRVPHLLLRWDERRWDISPQQMRMRLALTLAAAGLAALAIGCGGDDTGSVEANLEESEKTMEETYDAAREKGEGVA